MSEQSEKFSYRDVELVASEDVYNGFYRFTVNQLKHKKFQGGWSQTFSRELMVRPNAVGMLIYDPVLDVVALVEQFRVGAFMHAHLSENPEACHYCPWLLEMVAGLIDKDELPEQVAIRESKEEAGVDITASKFVQRYLSSPGGSNEEFHIFCGKADLSTYQSGQIFGLPEENEDIRLHIIPLHTLFNYLDNGQLNNAHTIIAVQWLRFHYHELKEEWGV